MKKYYAYLALSILLVPALVIAADRFDTKLVNKLKGRILLQVQRHGEAWYLNPADGKKYYMQDGNAAYAMMRKFGQGISDSDLDKIPTGVLEGSQTNFSTKSNNSPAISEQSQSVNKKETLIEKRVGDEVDLATYNSFVDGVVIFKFRVNSVREESSISGLFGTKAAKKGAKFVIVDLDVTNLIQSKFTFPLGGFPLVDNKSRQYETYSDSIGHIENSFDVRSLAPGIHENGILVYEVPNDAISYAIIADKAGTKDVYTVILK